MQPCSPRTSNRGSRAVRLARPCLPRRSRPCAARGARAHEPGGGAAEGAGGTRAQGARGPAPVRGGARRGSPREGFVGTLQREPPTRVWWPTYLVSLVHVFHGPFVVQPPVEVREDWEGNCLVVLTAMRSAQASLGVLGAGRGEDAARPTWGGVRLREWSRGVLQEPSRGGRAE